MRSFERQINALARDLAMELPLDNVEELPRHLFVGSDGVGVQWRAVLLEV
jgi:hypothetical protein